MFLKKDKVFLFLKGIAMGMADSVPGVSGGTIALITGIYEELINAIKSVNLTALKVFWQQGFLAAWKHINGNFLVTLFLGILSALIIMANTVVYLLASYPEYVLAFFIGLILASCLYVVSEINRWKFSLLVLLIAGISLSVGLAFVPQSGGEPSLLYVFFSGALAICAMILPGISGAFILLLLGVYEPVLGALRSFDVPVIIVFMLGCGLGLIAFSNVLSYLFKNFRNQTLVFLLGILIGSLYSLWPWRIETELEGRYQNFLPEQYSQLTGGEAHVLGCIGLVIMGFLLVYCLEKFSTTNNSSQELSNGESSD